MTAFSVSLINRDPATVESALEKIYLPALPLSAIMFHKALVSQYTEFAKNLRGDEVIKYFVKIARNGDFLESLSIEDGGGLALMMSQTTPTLQEVERFKAERVSFQPSFMASVALMHSLLPEVDRNVCYPNQKLGIFHTAALVLMHIDKTHVYSVSSNPEHAFALQGIGPDMETGPFFLIKSNSWANVSLNNYARHNSPFHPNAVSEAVH